MSRYTLKDDTQLLVDDRSRSILIIDIDEVVLHHSKHLIEYLSKLNITMTDFVHELKGELRDDVTGRLISENQKDRILSEGFKHFVHLQEPIPDSVKIINQLGTRYEILFLSNVPEHSASAREARLISLGLNYPFFRNGGGKGRAVKLISKFTDQRVCFVDDSLRQIENVKKHAPGTECFHFTFVDGTGVKQPPADLDVTRVRTWPELCSLLCS